MKSRKQAILAQSRLMRAIYGQTEGLDFEAKGLAVYQRSLAANAKRALAVSFPTIHQLVGDDCFTLLASDFLFDNPLSGGDWGEWGDEFPEWLTDNYQLDDYPYLGDCAQLDWLTHQGERAADAATDPESLALLGQADAYKVKLRFSADTAVLASAYPIVDIWEAHQATGRNDPESKQLLTKAAESIAEQKPQAALVWRSEWKATVTDITPGDYLWLHSCLQGNSIGDALDAVKHTDFNFENWLPWALQSGLVRGIDLTTH